jgi:hypothetical protein
MSGERDDVQGEQIAVLWDAEIGARVLEEDAWSRGPRSPTTSRSWSAIAPRPVEMSAERAALRDPRRGRVIAIS